MKAFELKNYRIIKVSFVSPTNTKGALVKISEDKRYNDDKNKSKVFFYDYATGDVMEQAFNILTRNGWNVICRGSSYDHYFFMCDKWGEDFAEVTDLK